MIGWAGRFGCVMLHPGVTRLRLCGVSTCIYRWYAEHSRYFYVLLPPSSLIGVEIQRCWLAAGHMYFSHESTCRYCIHVYCSPGTGMIGSGGTSF